MRWLRARRPETPSPDVEAFDNVTRLLDAAAHEAPLSPNAERIRMELLDELATSRRPVVGRVAVAAAAFVLLLAIAVGAGAPAIGSFIGELAAEPTSAPPRPSPPEVDRPVASDSKTTSKPLRTIGRDLPASVSASASAPASLPPQADPAAPLPAAGDEGAQPPPAGPPTPERTGPPMPVPTPPVTLPPGPP